VVWCGVDSKQVCNSLGYEACLQGSLNGMAYYPHHITPHGLKTNLPDMGVGEIWYGASDLN